MERYYNEKDELAVLLSKGFGFCWSSWSNPNLAFDKRIVDYFLQNGHYVHEYNLKEFLRSIGYDNVCVLGWSTIKIEWVPKGTKFKIREHDGNEYIEYFNEKEWEIA